MRKLQLSVAVGDYDRTRPIADGRVPIDGVDPVCLLLSAEEMFFRAFRQRAFDVSELSFSSYVVSLTRPEPHYVAVPVFLSRAFRHTSIYVRDDRGIEGPEHLAGKRIGVAEYQLTANVWVRALLEADYGVTPASITWVRGGMDASGRTEKIEIELPSDITLEEAPEGEGLNEMLAAGAIDGFIGPRAPRCFDEGHPRVRRLFPDTIAAASEYYRRTSIFPIMHVLGVRRRIAEAHPWLPATLVKAFEAAKQLALEALADTSATKVTLPFIADELQRARELMGSDHWSYGVAENLPALDAFLDHHHRQGLSARRVGVDELFHPSTYETFSL